jgi:hypothetical protein
MSEIVYSNIADCPEVKGLVARWLWSFWGAPGNFEFYRSMTEHCKKDGIPAVYIAFIDGMPVGTVALLRADLFSRQDLYPWMADLYVPPETEPGGPRCRLRAGGGEKAGFREIYLYTPLKGYYEKKAGNSCAKRWTGLPDRADILKQLLIEGGERLSLRRRHDICLGPTPCSKYIPSHGPRRRSTQPARDQVRYGHQAVEQVGDLPHEPDPSADPSTTLERYSTLKPPGTAA